MVLSRLVLNLNNARARRDFSSPYELHSTIRRLTENTSTRPLWRLEDSGYVESPPTILIQTQGVPDISNLHKYDEDYVYSFETRPNRLLGNLEKGDILCFRIRANPTVTRGGKRHGLYKEEEQLAWIGKQMDQSGVRVIDARVVSSRRDSFRKRFRGIPITLQNVIFDGRLEVLSASDLQNAVIQGVGPAKSFGFGLITLSRC